MIKSNSTDPAKLLYGNNCQREGEFGQKTDRILRKNPYCHALTATGGRVVIENS